MCGETLGDLEPVYDLLAITSEFTLTEAVTQTCSDIFVKQGLFRTGPFPCGKFTPPTKQECGETLRGQGPVYNLFMFTSEFTLSEAVVRMTCP